MISHLIDPEQVSQAANMFLPPPSSNSQGTSKTASQFTRATKATINENLSGTKQTETLRSTSKRIEATGFDASLLQSKLPSRSPDLTCDITPNSNNFVSQTSAQQVIHKYATDIISRDQKPRFVPILLELMALAQQQDSTMLTVQLGGMDGYTGDPFYRMTQLYNGPNNLQHWLPVTIEPVPTNFEKLVHTYQDHKRLRNLQCGHMLKQLINYDPKQESPPGKCGFCHFDTESTLEECVNLPTWHKTEIGSMECTRDNLKTCFVRSEFDCTSIGYALDVIPGIAKEHVVVLQIDVEGFEQQVLEGYFGELSGPEAYPSVINFENKVLKSRGKLVAVYEFLKSRGYSLHEKRVDTLAILGFEGDTKA